MPKFRVKFFVENSSWDIEADSLDEALSEASDDPLVSRFRESCEDDYRLEAIEIPEDEEEDDYYDDLSIDEEDEDE